MLSDVCIWRTTTKKNHFFSKWKMTSLIENFFRPIVYTRAHHHRIRRMRNFATQYVHVHGLRTPNEGINQRYLKNWADVADKIYCRHT